jgi:hypothetical protein
MLDDSPYLRNGAPQCCALFDAPFMIGDGHVMCWRGNDGRYYCCPRHADLGLENAFVTIVRFRGKVS